MRLEQHPVVSFLIKSDDWPYQKNAMLAALADQVEASLMELAASLGVPRGPHLAWDEDFGGTYYFQYEKRESWLDVAAHRMAEEIDRCIIEAYLADTPSLGP